VGRLTSIANGEEETTYEWDLFDHLASVKGPGGNANYAYDALDRLSERTTGSGTTVTHYGDVTDLPILETDAEGETATSYVSGAGGLLEQRSGEATSYPLRDGHGDVTVIADAGGEVTSRQSYDPWGPQLSGPAVEMGYLGSQQRRTDPAAGLIQMGARAYSPTLGVFLSEDPVLAQVGLGITANRYPYAWNNPMTLVDLDGRFPSLGEGAGAVGGVIDDGWDSTADGRDFIGIAGAGNGGVAGNLVEGGVNYANHVADFWSERYSDFVKDLKESCGTSFGQRALDDFVVTNKAVPGLIAPTLASAAINRWGGVATSMGARTPWNWLRRSRNLSELPKVARASGLSWIYASLAWEAGVGIGSLARSGFTEIYC
jgi:RHS repeat-associated protein